MLAMTNEIQDLRPGALGLWVVLARAFNSVRAQAATHAGRHGLTLAEFEVLEVLHHTGPMVLTAIQRKLLISSGGTTYLVDELENAGLVRRRPSTTDRRVRYVALTPKGQRFIAKIFPEHEAHLTQVLAGLSATEQEQARRLLRKLGRHAAQLGSVAG